ncbi:MAG: YbhB/YbcL family Raf kinase inhibitor-like protein [Anaerolineae bacterium]|nr:YbhB/YbcL family Raf kinase inhibitor-like protein [Anaerolineae bacterium]
MAFSLSSRDFAHEDVIPLRHTCEGDDISPEMTWTDPPPGTVEYALVVHDPDAPRGDWVHWIVYHIPVNVRTLPQDFAKERVLSDGTHQGLNDFGKIGYGGPCPPPGHGPHRYYFTLYALDVRILLPPGANKANLLTAMEGYIVGQATLMGRFERTRSH